MKFITGDQVVFTGRNHPVQDIYLQKKYTITSVAPNRFGGYIYEIYNEKGTSQIFSDESSDIELFTPEFRDKYFMMGDKIVVMNGHGHPFTHVQIGKTYEIGEGFSGYIDRLWIRNDIGVKQIFKYERKAYDGIRLLSDEMIDNRWIGELQYEV